MLGVHRHGTAHKHACRHVRGHVQRHGMRMCMCADLQLLAEGLQVVFGSFVPTQMSVHSSSRTESMCRSILRAGSVSAFVIVNMPLRCMHRACARLHTIVQSWHASRKNACNVRMRKHPRIRISVHDSVIHTSPTMAIPIIEATNNGRPPRMGMPVGWLPILGPSF